MSVAEVSLRASSEVPIEPRLSEQWFLRYPKTKEALDVIRRTPLEKVLGGSRMFFNVEQAVTAWRETERLAWSTAS